MRRVAILAAGVGERLRPLTNQLPKALLAVGTETLLAHQARALQLAGVEPSEIVVMAGHQRDELQAAASELGISLLFNPDYQRANNIVSLRSVFQTFADASLSEVVVVNCDVWAHPEIFNRLLETTADAAVVVDAERPPDGEAMKVTLDQDRVVRFGKDMVDGLAHGEYVGLARFRGRSLHELSAAVGALVSRGRVNEWYESAFNEIAPRVPIAAVSTHGLPWIEIDTHADYHRAQSLCQGVLS